jgi:glutamate-5-semialdehyde dehydrogenase
MENLVKTLMEVRAASKILALLSTQEKNDSINLIADRLWARKELILQANLKDIDNAKAAGMQPAMLDRLTLDDCRWKMVVEDLRKVAELPDPVGQIIEKNLLSNGLDVSRQRVPLGVLAVIYEARPNVTVDVVGLAIKSGNGVVLRGGKETLHTNKAIIKAIEEALGSTFVPSRVVLFIDDPDRNLLLQLMKRYDLIDMLIPRGGAGLHQFCRENSMIPVITGGIGICHLFVDDSADFGKAIEVIRNAKIQRPTVCNALDTALVHKDIAREFIPALVDKLRSDGVVFYADPEAYGMLDTIPEVHAAMEGDFDKEWLSLCLGIKIVSGLEEAVQHIQIHSTGHSDGIISENNSNIDQFIKQVDSAAVYVNASTRFTDGSALGLGAEIAISTQKLHARGPMGLVELTTYKWVIKGDYHTRK